MRRTNLSRWTSWIHTCRTLSSHCHYWRLGKSSLAGHSASSRSGSANAQCSSNMRNLGLAVLNFESAYKMLPRSGEHWAPNPSAPTADRTKDLKTQDFQALTTLILPYVDQQSVYDSFNLKERYNDIAVAATSTLPAVSGANITAFNNGFGASALVPVYLCPTNRFVTTAWIRLDTAVSTMLHCRTSKSAALIRTVRVLLKLHRWKAACRRANTSRS